MLTRERKAIAFAVYPGVTPLDLVGPLTVLRDLGLGSPYQTVVVGRTVEAMPTDCSLQLIPSRTFAEVRSPFAIFIPGGGAATLEAIEDGALLSYVRACAASAEMVGSTGNGALVLAAAGLLQGRRAAIHWAYRGQLERFGVTYAEESWVEDGRFLTAASGAAGIDMMLDLVARLRGPSRAKLTQVVIEYDPQPPFEPADRTDTAPKLAWLLFGSAGLEAGEAGERVTG